MKYFGLIFITCLVITACSENKAEEKKIPLASSAPSYQTATVQKGSVSSTVRLPAQLAAYQEVSIFPKVNGYVKTVSVDIGSKVSKGDLLMMLEAPELLQAAMQAKEKYARSKADFSLDKERYNRLLEAAKTEGAISPLDLSTVRSKMEADSAVCNAEKTNWQMQETMLGYLRVTAPFNGIITERNIHPGALVNAAAKDKPMLELKQLDHLRLQADIPEGLSAGLKDKDTVCFYVSALQGKKLTGTINRKSNNINPAYRSERMEIDVPNKEGVLSAGMYVDLVLYPKGSANVLSVPKSAVVTSTEGKYVLKMTDKKIKKVNVSTGNSSVDKTEVYGDLQTGDMVIVNANDEIKETK
ncbi:MAG: efflux RND transporter periplasmic adaptor subunit [Bacteroidetes bacterium]|nr:efflux RND transporter periplasmic adaptor subunit [Bacteroidota bacterium]